MPSQWAHNVHLAQTKHLDSTAVEADSGKIIFITAFITYVEPPPLPQGACQWWNNYKAISYAHLQVIRQIIMAPCYIVKIGVVRKDSSMQVNERGQKHFRSTHPHVVTQSGSPTKVYDLNLTNSQSQYILPCINLHHPPQ